MLYEKSREKYLSDALFRDPSAEYRGAPFWAWNDELDEAECVRQAHIFREMGFGGYHMHPRSGLKTPYFGDKFKSCVRACVEDAKKTGMLAWLYDEDRYPSGFAGGAVTKDGRYRRRALVFTRKKRKEDATFCDGRQTGGSKLLATYAVRFIFGNIFGYKRILPGQKRRGGTRYYAYLVVDEPTDEFNQAGYVDTLSKEALDAFADYTFGTYREIAGEEFGKTVPAIFTDEPQMKFLSPFKSTIFPKEAVIPWTDDFAETYREAYNEDVFDRLPEIFFHSNRPSVYYTRYLYHIHRTERFARAFADNLGQRADALGFALTGHMMEEPTLQTQSRAVGEAMRQYKHFGIPGIDMLCGRHEFTTAKQAQSVVRQEGREGMMCELYGVSRWAVEFGKFKEEGDWLACLGVTVRVPHLSYYSMRGEAKRDYPPSIFFQSPWYRKFKPIEDHFARLNTALTRGKALNDLAVIHPIESLFVNLAADGSGADMRKKMDRDFLDLTDWLLYNGYDFDFISESLLPSQVKEDALAVGECRYRTILVPNLVTMRRTTYDFLVRFLAAGGFVVFLGGVPRMIEGLPTHEIERFAENCMCIPCQKGIVLSFLAAMGKDLTVTSARKKEGYLSTLREDGDGRWVFLTSPRQNFPYPHSVPVTNDPKVVKDTVTVTLKGEWTVREYDTMTGEIRPLVATVAEGTTTVTKVMYNNDSLLLRYDVPKGEPLPETDEAEAERETIRTFALSGDAEYELDEPNVLLLDKAAWSVGGAFHAREDLDIATAKARKALGLPKYRENLQPWLQETPGEKGRVTLRFEFDSKVALPAHFALEYTEYDLSVNGERITAEPDGYYVDLSIRTLPIRLIKGRNVIEIVLPMGEYDRFENCYLLGDFGVEKIKGIPLIGELPRTISFRDVTDQKMPFYSGKITYRAHFTSNGERADISFKYASALLTVRVNDEEKDIYFAPYSASFPTRAGENDLTITAYVSRENAFGAVHIRRDYKRSDSPSWFRTRCILHRTRGYVLDRGGLLEPPAVRLVKE